MSILERLKELHAKATPGPWHITEDLFNERPEVRDSGGRRIAVVTTDFPLSAKTVTANAELITLLRSNLPALLEVVEGSKDYLTTLKALTPIADEQIAQAVEILNEKAKILSNNIAKLEAPDA